MRQGLLRIAQESRRFPLFFPLCLMILIQALGFSLRPSLVPLLSVFFLLLLLQYRSREEMFPFTFVLGLLLFSYCIHGASSYEKPPLHFVPDKEKTYLARLVDLNEQITEEGEVKLRLLLEQSIAGPDGKKKTRRLEARLGKKVHSNVRGRDIGRWLRWSGSIDPNEGPRLPGAYSSYQNHLAQGVYLSCRIEKLKWLSASNQPLYLLRRMRYEAKERVRKRGEGFFSPDAWSLISALGWGEKSRLRPEMQEGFRRAGLSHLLVVSGAHLSFVLELLTFLLQSLPLGIRRRLKLLFFLMTLFALLCSFQPSISRAWGMAALRLGSRSRKRPIHGFHALTFAVLFYLLVYPYRLFHLGFWMSTAATAAIQLLLAPVYISRDDPARSGRRSPWIRLQRSLSFYLACRILLLPFLIAMRSRELLLAPLFQLLCSPVAGLLTMVSFPTFFLLLFLGSWGILPVYLPLKGLSFLLLQACHLANQDHLRFVLYSPSCYPLSFALLVLLLLYYLRKKRGLLRFFVQRKGAICLVLLLSCLSWALLHFARPQAELFFLDVGQGDAALLELDNGKTLLIDAGVPEVGKRLERVLDARGIHQVDALLISHLHLDHFGGGFHLLKTGRIRTVYIPDWGSCPPCRDQSREWSRFLQCIEKAQIPLYGLQELEGRLSAAVSLRCQLPPLEHCPLIENNASVFSTLHLGPARILLAGDGQHEAWAAFGRDLPPIDLLKLSHHGSRNGITAELLSQLQVQVGVISCGRQNPYGHPHEDVLHWLKMAQCQTHRTDREGSLHLQLRRGRVRLKSYGGEEGWRPLRMKPQAIASFEKK